MQRYWMVLGEGRPSVKHQSLEAARAEAARLSRLYRGKKFVVLQAVGEVLCPAQEPPPVQWSEPDRLPGVWFKTTIGKREATWCLNSSAISRDPREVGT